MSDHLPPRAPVASLRSLAGDALLELTIRGSSMSPALSDGDAVRVRPDRRALPGDVVLFRRGPAGPLVAHRVLGLYRRRGEWRLVARGDALGRADAPTPWKEVVGRLDVPASPWTRLVALARFAAWGARRARESFR